jgi:hypothetical protein
MLRPRTILPSWLISLLLHLGLVLLLALFLDLDKTQPPQAAAGERTAEVGIVLKKSADDVNYFQGPDDSGESQSAGSGTTGKASSVDQLLNEKSPSDPTNTLPSGLPIIGAGALEDGKAGTAAGAAGGTTGIGARDFGGRAKTGVFGLEGEGYKFVYVFDRSASMERPGRNVLATAKAQIVASIAQLGQTHQFQVIFYNEHPRRFMQFEQPNKLFFANERNKKLVEKFVGGITARGGTEHEQALLLAISLRPDVIFFLTDADEPRMSPDQLAKIHRRAEGITINAIEFGFGPQADKNSWIVRLAKQNGGRHVYGDVTKLFPGR